MKSYGNSYLDSEALRNLGFAGVGDHVLIHATCVMVGLENIRIGSRVRVDAFASLVAASGTISVGNHVHISGQTFLSASNGITIGDFVSVSHGVRLYTRNDDYTGEALTGPTVPAKYLNLDEGPIHIGRHAIIGAGSVVLPNVSIGDGSTVGALSLVKESLDSWGIYGGIPARKLRDRSRKLLQMEAQLLAEEAGGDD
jgi:galactoside O-acetyltransferase